MSKKGKLKKQEVAMQVRVPAESLALFKKAADNDRRSLSGWVRDRLERAAKAEMSQNAN